nr:zinc finger protein on ecdysone puffs-like [Rhipicephalus microplus]
MSRRQVPDNPWQNGMPPFGYWPPQMHPMMNTGPMWAPQGSLPFMGGGSVAPDMMRYRGNVSSHTNFRRPYDQPDRYRPRHGYDDRYGNRQGRGDRKRHGPSGERSRSPASKRGAPHRDGAQKDQEQPNRQGASEGEASAAENEAERASGTQADDLYDPAEPTTEDTVEGAETAEGQEQRGTGEGDATESADQEGGTSGQQNEVGSGEGASTSTGAAAKLIAKPSGSKASGTKSTTKGAVAKGQTGGRVAQKARQEQGNKKGGQKDGWCTVCEINFVGHFFDHRKLDEHKKKRDEKYPKCHTCSMSFSNREHYDHHCGGVVHLKNVEVEEDVQLAGSDGTLGEEYLEEVRGYFCTLCNVFMKEELKPYHCKTLGHHKRQKDAKRKEGAGKNTKSASENTEDEDETNQVAYTITDEVGSDDEARTAASDGAGPSGVTIKPKKENVAEETDHTMRETPDEPSRVEPVMLESEADGQSEPVKEEIKEQDDLQEEHQAEEQDAPEHEAASADMSVLDEQEQTNVPSTNGCKDSKEEVGEKPVAASPSISAAPATFKAALSKATPAKAPGRNLAAPKAAAAVAKPAATVAAKPAVAIPRPTAPVSKPTAAVSKSTGTVAKPPVAAARVPAINSAASTSASAAAGTKKPPAVALPAPAVTTSASAAAGTKKPPAVALPAPAVTVPAPAAVAGRGGTARGRGRGVAPKAVRARKR